MTSYVWCVKLGEALNNSTVLMISSPFMVKIENEIDKQLSTLYRHLVKHTIFFKNIVSDISQTGLELSVKPRMISTF